MAFNLNCAWVPAYSCFLYIKKKSKLDDSNFYLQQKKYLRIQKYTLYKHFNVCSVTHTYIQNVQLVDKKIKKTSVR